MTNDAMFAQTEKFLAPAKELNKLALKNAEKMVDLQIASMKEFAKIGLTNWKDALSVSDVATFQAYAGKQREIAQDVMKKMAEDTKTVAELGNGYFGEARKIFQDSVAEVTKKAA